MDLSNEPLKEEYERWKNEIGPNDPYDGPTTIGIHDVLRAHFLLLDFFTTEVGDGIGGIGPRELNLLHSAVSRQTAGFGGHAKYSDKYEVCATLFFGLIMNHPFHDANKRT